MVFHLCDRYPSPEYSSVLAAIFTIGRDFRKICVHCAADDAKTRCHCQQQPINCDVMISVMPFPCFEIRENSWKFPQIHIFYGWTCANICHKRFRGWDCSVLARQENVRTNAMPMKMTENVVGSVRIHTLELRFLGSSGGSLKAVFVCVWRYVLEFLDCSGSNQNGHGNTPTIQDLRCQAWAKLEVAKIIFCRSWVSFLSDYFFANIVSEIPLGPYTSKSLPRVSEVTTRIHP